MLVSVAFAPDSPLLVPEVSVVEDAHLRALRETAVDAVRTALDARPDLVVVVGPGPRALGHPASDWGSLAAFGVDVRFFLGPTACGGSPSLSPALTVGAWLLSAGRASGGQRSSYDVTAFEVPAAASDADLDLWAEELRELPGRVGLVAMGSGSACHGPAAPAGADGRAPEFDEAVARALTEGDPEGLATLDAQLGREVVASGAQTWRLVGRSLRRTYDSVSWRARLAHRSQPYGVGYLVASWHDTAGLEQDRA